MLLLLALNLCAFLLALSLSALVTRTVLNRRRPDIVIPREGAALRIRAESAVYRSRFLGAGRHGWSFSAPLQRDNFVPIRVGERLVIEAEGPFGRLLFRSVLVDRDGTSGQMTVDIPKRVFQLPHRFVELETEKPPLLVEQER